MKSIINLKRDIEKPQKIKEEAAQSHTEYVEIQQFENKEIKERIYKYINI